MWWCVRAVGVASPAWEASILPLEARASVRVAVDLAELQVITAAVDVDRFEVSFDREVPRPT